MYEHGHCIQLRLFRAKIPRGASEPRCQATERNATHDVWVVDFGQEPHLGWLHGVLFRQEELQPVSATCRGTGKQNAPWAIESHSPLERNMHRKRYALQPLKWVNAVSRKLLSYTATTICMNEAVLTFIRCASRASHDDLEVSVVVRVGRSLNPWSCGRPSHATLYKQSKVQHQDDA